MKRVLALVLLLVLGAFSAVAATAALDSEKTACATASASTPEHVLSVDGGSVHTIPGDSASDVQCVTVTADTVTVSGPTTTVTQTVTKTVTAQSDPPSNCTKTLAAGGDLSTFFATLVSGDVACLHGGSYTDGSAVSFSKTNVTLSSYPGERAELVGTGLLVSGTGDTISDLTIRDVLATDVDGMRVDGSGHHILENSILHVARHGILLGSSSSRVEIARNFIDQAGADGGSHASSLGPTQLHGIYAQGDNQTIDRNLITRSSGYGVHLYAHPSGTIVSENTIVGSITRAGILIDSSGGGLKVVNNILANNGLASSAGSTTAGITYRSCSAGGCVVDQNLCWNNKGGDIGGTLAGQATHTIHADPQFSDGAYRVSSTSPAVETARSDYAFSPDRDGNAIVGVPDLGAYER